MPTATGVATLHAMTDVAVHRALADPTRVAILDRLRSSDAEEDVVGLATAVGVHANTVRAHLSVLERAGLARSRSEERVLPGRPRRLWSATAPEEAEHSLLAEALVGALEPLEEGATLAEKAGEAWGRRLCVRERSGGADALEQLDAILERRGFVPQACDEGIAMRKCPFRELAEQNPRVVCGFHAGLISGALLELEASWRLEELVPWASADRCVARLVPAEA